jgi:hypothetical protein
MEEKLACTRALQSLMEKVKQEINLLRDGHLQWHISFAQTHLALAFLASILILKALLLCHWSRLAQILKQWF